MADTRKLVVRVPGLPDGEPVEVLFLGLHPNGTSINLTDEQVGLYERLFGQDFPSSGYVIAGEPKTAAEKTAYDANIAEQEAKLNPPSEPTPEPTPTPEGGN